jgi:molybdopterin/thiamine biosynthesis adenylyltransferase
MIPLDAASRYARQILLPSIGPEGQERLRSACVAVVGLGALGSVEASYLARAGVGTLRLIDRDTVELHNLQRQILYTESDAREGLPKAVAARRHLEEVNSEIRLIDIPEHLGKDNIGEILSGCTMVLDGTDNLEARFLLNDFSVREGVPWIYAACVGTEALVGPIFPGRTPCLRCRIAPESSAAEPTCDTAGILGPVAGTAGSVAASQALLVLAGEPAFRGVLRIDARRGDFRLVLEDSEPDPACRACALRRFDFLEGDLASSAHVLCGRGAVQILPSGRKTRCLEEAGRRLARFGEVQRSRFLIRATLEGYSLALFPDGRIIVGGTTDPSRARALVDRYLGGI